MLRAVREEARRELWRRGLAHEVLLDTAGTTGGQQAWRQRLYATKPLASSVWNIGRQRGKTFCAVFLAIETCVTLPNAVVRYCAKTKDSAAAIVTPAWESIIATLPFDWRPTKGRTEYEWKFPTTGATFVLFGTDAQSFSKGRGPRTDLQLLDEVGFYQDLEPVESALLPSLQTTGGRVLYLSTPPESLGHPYVQRIRVAQAGGNYTHDTFWSNPRVNHENVISAECQRLGYTREQLLASTYFRREYLAELVAEESRAAFPAWGQTAHSELVGDWQRPQYWDGYQALDPGKVGDPHAWLAGWYDPTSGTLTIEDELELRSASHTVAALAEAVKAKETALYGAKRWDGTLLGAGDYAKEFGRLPEYLQRSTSLVAPRQPYLRVGDNNDGLALSTLAIEHGIAVVPSRKDDKHLAVDAVNQLIIQKRLRIHKRCVRLIEQLYSTTWNRTRSEWERTDKDHADLVDCIVFIVRNVRWNRDCRPPQATQFLVPQQATGLDSWDKILRR
jgi:hypothetical protein